jgi:hypothetical protein
MVAGARPLSTRNSIYVSNVMVETTGNCTENKIQKAASVLTARVWFALVDGLYAVASLSLTLSAYNSKFFGISTNIHTQNAQCAIKWTSLVTKIPY